MNKDARELRRRAIEHHPPRPHECSPVNISAPVAQSPASLDHDGRARDRRQPAKGLPYVRNQRRVLKLKWLLRGQAYSVPRATPFSCLLFFSKHESRPELRHARSITLPAVAKNLAEIHVRRSLVG